MNKIKKLEISDNLDEYLDLINQLKFTNINLNLLKNIINKSDIYILLIDNKIVGSITFILEQKIIHDGKFVLHIEDLVINKEYRGKGLASKLLNYGKEYAQKNNCYKIILNCDEKLKLFYEGNGFSNKNIEMSYYF